MAVTGGGPGWGRRSRGLSGVRTGVRVAAGPRSRRVVECRAAASRHPAAVRCRTPPPRRRGVRLTRRGRRVVMVLVVSFWALVALLPAAAAMAAGR